MVLRGGGADFESQFGSTFGKTFLFYLLILLFSSDYTDFSDMNEPYISVLNPT